MAVYHLSAECSKSLKRSDEQSICAISGCLLDTLLRGFRCDVTVTVGLVATASLSQEKLQTTSRGACKSQMTGTIKGIQRPSWSKGLRHPSVICNAYFTVVFF